jgi:hypothetical protein
MKFTGIRRQALRRGMRSHQRRAIARFKTQWRTISRPVKEHITRLVADLGNRASAWRDAAVDAELAYRRWQQAPKEERCDAAAVYLAAIEREEKAAAEYRRALEACCNTTPYAACRPL